MLKIKDFISNVRDYYYITKDGNVISRARKREITLSPGEKNNGYLQVSLMKDDGKIMYVSIHRLVAICYLGFEENKIVNHKNGNKKNNTLHNLEWVSQKQNIEHAWINELAKARVGDSSNLASITAQEASRIVSLLRKGKTDKEISELTGANIRGIISRIRRRETWKHLTEEGEILGKSQKRK